MSKQTKIRKQSAKKAKEFREKELKAFAESHPKPDRASYIKSEKAYGADPIMYPNDLAEYEAALEQFWQAWAEYTLTPEYQDRIPKSDVVAVHEKFSEWVSDLSLSDEQHWKLWEKVKGFEMFQLTGGKGSGC